MSGERVGSWHQAVSSRPRLAQTRSEPSGRSDAAGSRSGPQVARQLTNCSRRNAKSEPSGALSTIGSSIRMLRTHVAREMSATMIRIRWQKDSGQATGSADLIPLEWVLKENTFEGTHKVIWRGERTTAKCSVTGSGTNVDLDYGATPGMASARPRAGFGNLDSRLSGFSA